MYTLFFMDYPELILLANSSLWTPPRLLRFAQFLCGGWLGGLAAQPATTQKKK